MSYDQNSGGYTGQDCKSCANRNFYKIKNSKKICDLDISKFNSEDCKYTTLKRSKLFQFLKKQINEDIIKYNHNIEQIVYDKDSIKLIFDKINDYLGQLSNFFHILKTIV